MRPCAVALFLLLHLLSGRARASDRSTIYGLRIEVGAEYDTNPTRRESVQGLPDEARALPSAALRIAVAGELEQRATDRLFLSLGATAATRRLLRLDVEGEDLLVSDARAALAYSLADGWSLAAGASYYDVIQRADSLEEARDFRSISPVGRLYGRLGEGRLQLAGGWRWFRFKPAPAFDFDGPTASLGYRRQTAVGLEGGAEWDFGLGSSIEQRRFARYPCGGTDCPVGSTTLRRDRFLTLDADVTRTGDELLGGGLSLQRNSSDRYGESLWRALLHLRLVWLLPWDLSLAARGELVITRYSDAVPVGHDSRTGTFVTIEDEGRSSLRVDLSHPLGGRFEGGVRYTFYSHTPGTKAVSFRRHLALVYLSVGFGR